MATALTVRAGIPEKDDCKVLTRLKAFIVDQGVCAALEHTFRDRTGNPQNLSAWLAGGTSESGSSSSSSSVPAGTVKLRIKEWMSKSRNGAKNPVWTLWGEAVDAASGVIRAELEPSVVERAGIYELNWAIVDENGRPVAIDRGILSVEKSLFPVVADRIYENLGPPTLQEVRMRIMDSSRNENLLLDDVEFNDDQILLAMQEPVRFWNEIPPPIRTFTTVDFPFRGAWISGVLAQLHLMAANHYRRNVLRQAAGGGSDKDKEREYLTEGTRLWDEYKGWCYNKKVEINLKGFAGNVHSAYLTRSGW